jgi:hypothetical protein
MPRGGVGGARHERASLNTALRGLSTLLSSRQARPLDDSGFTHVAFLLGAARLRR